MLRIQCPRGDWATWECIIVIACGTTFPGEFWEQQRSICLGWFYEQPCLKAGAWIRWPVKIVIHPSDFSGKDAFAEFEKSPGGTLIGLGSIWSRAWRYLALLEIGAAQCHPVPWIQECYPLHVDLAFQWFHPWKLYAYIVKIFDYQQNYFLKHISTDLCLEI